MKKRLSLLLILVFVLVGCQRVITFEEWQAVHNGMSNAEVTEAIGKPTKKITNQKEIIKHLNTLSETITDKNATTEQLDTQKKIIHSLQQRVTPDTNIVEEIHTVKKEDQTDDYSLYLIDDHVVLVSIIANK